MPEEGNIPDFCQVALKIPKQETDFWAHNSKTSTLRA